MNKEITITIEQLEILLNEQKRLVYDRLYHQSYIYNSESTPGHINSMNIDKNKFAEVAMAAKFPEHFNVLKTYLK